MAAVLSAFHWVKLKDLTGGDSVRWFLEVARATSGEVPYRDYSWLYPPAGLWIFVAACKLGGASFAVIQTVIDLLSGLLCLLVWRLARKLLDRGPAFCVAAFFAVAGASNSSNFALFSLDVYAPGLLTGTVGLLLFLHPLVAALREDRPADLLSFDRGEKAAIIAGAVLACLSKLEFMLGVAGVCMAFPLLGLLQRQERRWSVLLRRVLVLGASACLPAVLVLIFVGTRTGGRQLLEALGGYGVGRITCPWWPTGLGVLSILGALSRGVVFAAVLSLLRFRGLLALHGRRYLRFLGVAAVAAVIMVATLPYALHEFARSQPKGMSQIVVTMRYLMSLTSLLHPVTWTGIAFLIYNAFRARRREFVAPSTNAWLLMIVAGTLVSSRSLFGDIFSRVGVVFPSSYPIWFIVTAGALLALLRRLGGALAARRNVLVGASLLLYALMRLGSLVQSSRGSLYRTLETEAGPVKVQAYDMAATLYQAILARTKPDDRILEVPFGGGLTFASRRRSSLFLTQFVGLFPSAFIESLDEEKLRAAPPDLVIADRTPRLGAGKGVALGCSLPHFSFVAPDHVPESEPEQPSLVSIEAHYIVADRIGDKELLVPASPPTP